MKNIIFLIDDQRGVSGGAKAIYQYSNYINSLDNYSSSIIHVKKKKIKKIFESINKKFKGKLLKKKFSGWSFKDLKVKKNYSFPWFDIKINIKNDLIFDKKKDLVILPEIFAHFGIEFLKKKIPYAIFMQNPYSIFPTNNFKKLKTSYEKAKLILHYSKEMKKGILNAFPKSKLKLFEVGTSINSSELKFSKKFNIITYMPRKLPLHSSLVINFLNQNLPNNWKIHPIDNLSRKKTFNELKKSKIFLSFSFLEGLGMPPLEAAISGNKVIGYDGEGGKEYWKKPIFVQVNNGNIFDFCEKVLKNLNDKNFIKNSSKQREKIIKKYSFETTQKKIEKFLNKIK